MNRLHKYVSNHRLESIIVVILLLLAAFLRIYKISDYLTFLGDEGRDVLVVYNILHGHLTLLGPTSSVGGFFLGPIYYYFMAPFLLLANYDPSGPALMIALLGTFTVFLEYIICQEIFGRKAAFFAAALYAVSPVVIAYSRSSWNPNPMPFFTLITLYLLYKAVKKNSLKLYAVVGVLFGICMQLHYIETFVGLVILLYTVSVIFILNRKCMLIHTIVTLGKSYTAILVGFLIGFSPFIAFEVRHGFPDIQGIFNFIFHSKEVTASGDYLQIVTNVFFRLFGRLVTRFPPPEQYHLFTQSAFTLWYNATMFLGLTSFILFVFQYIKSTKKPSDKFLQLHLLFLWFALGILLFGLYRKPIYDYYFEFLFPLPFFFVGNFLSVLYQSSFNKLKIGVVLSITIFSLLFFGNLAANPFSAQPNRQKAQIEGIANFVLSKTDNMPFNFALLSQGNSDHAYRYYFTIKHREPVQIEHKGVLGDPKTITSQLLIVCEDPACQPLGAPLWEVAGFGQGEIVGKWKTSVVTVYKIIHYQSKK